MRCSTIGPSASAGTKVSAPTSSTTPTAAPRREGYGSAASRPRRDDLLRRQRARDGERGDGQPVAGEQHGKAQRGVVEGRIGAEPSERAAVVVAGRGERVEDLAEAVGPGVGDARLAPRGDNRDRGADQHDRGRDQDDERGHLHLVGLDLLAQVLGRAADHEAGHEHGDDREDEHPVEARADPAVDDLAELHQPHGHQPAEGGVGVVHRVHRAVGGRGGGRGPQGGVGDTEPDLLALHVAAGLQGAGGVIHALLHERTPRSARRPRTPPAAPRRSRSWRRGPSSPAACRPP